MTPIVRAPGKAMLLGEYAVLDGAWGMVAAVDRYACARLGDSPPQGPFVARAIEAAHAHLARLGRARPPGAPRVDSRALYDSGPGQSGRKLGLGSSAATTVCAFGAVLAAAGLDPQDPARLIDVFGACDEAHALAQGVRGSGLDIAASVWGGVVRARRQSHPETGAPVLRIEPLAWPSELAILLVDTGVAATTADRVARYRALDRQQSDVAAVLAALAQLADSVTPAALLADAAALMSAWNRHLAALERLIALPILTPPLCRVAEIAASLGGGAKPSGAGGGDLAVCFIARAQAPTLAGRLLAAGLSPLPLDIGHGVSGVSLAPHPISSLESLP